jgi:hypothetical protein
VKDNKYSPIYRIMAKDHRLFGVEVLCEEMQLYTDFKYDKSGFPYCENYNSKVTEEETRGQPKTSGRKQYVTVDGGEGVRTGEMPVALCTDGLLGCVAFFLKGKGAGFLAHIFDRINCEEAWAPLSKWAQGAVNAFIEAVGSPPDSLTIIRNAELNFDEKHWNEYLQVLCPPGIDCKVKTGDSIFEEIEAGDSKNESTWTFRVNVLSPTLDALKSPVPVKT